MKTEFEKKLQDIRMVPLHIYGIYQENILWDRVDLFFF